MTMGWKLGLLRFVKGLRNVINEFVTVRGTFGFTNDVNNLARPLTLYLVTHCYANLARNKGNISLTTYSS